MTRRPIRVCMVNGQYLPVIGGVERQMYQHAVALRSRGHVACIVTYRIRRDWPRQEVMNGVPVIRTGGIYLRTRLLRRWGLATLPVLLELIKRREQYDVIHAFQMLELAWVATVAGRLLGKPVVMDTACSGLYSEFRYLPQHYGAIGRWMINAMCRSTAVVVARGTESIEEIHAAGIPDHRIRSIPYGVDTETFRPRHTADGAGAAPRRVAICTARLVPQKALDILLLAWKSVVDEIPEARLQIVGGGYLHGDLVALRHQLHLDGNVDFVGETDDVAGCLAHADLYVLSSRAEGLPNALLEAMATGLPCVATRVGGTEDVIKHGVTGLLVDPEDAPGLARAILHFMQDPALADACGQAARIRMEQEFSLDRQVERFLCVYEDMLAPKASVQPT